MDYKLFSKDELRIRCVTECMRMVRNLTSRRLMPDGEYIEPMSQLEISSILHLTQSQMSRITTGVCVPSAPVFYRLQELYKQRLENGLV